MRATVRHILVKTQGLAKQVLDDLAAGADFIDLAQEFSACPSATVGGDLGTFEPDDLPDPFRSSIFSPDSPVHTPFGPVKTEFGLHIIEITQRTGVAERSMSASTTLDTEGETTDQADVASPKMMDNESDRQKDDPKDPQSERQEQLEIPARDEKVEEETP